MVSRMVTAVVELEGEVEAPEEARTEVSPTAPESHTEVQRRRHATPASVEFHP
jgi:hypothetical protein